MTIEYGLGMLAIGIIAILIVLVITNTFFFPLKIREMINFMPGKFPKKTLPKMKVYKAIKKTYLNSAEVIGLL